MKLNLMRYFQFQQKKRGLLELLDKIISITPERKWIFNNFSLSKKRNGI